MSENNYFDKFMDDLVKRQQLEQERMRQLQQHEEQANLRRTLDHRYREHLMHRIRYTK